MLRLRFILIVTTLFYCIPSVSAGLADSAIKLAEDSAAKATDVRLPLSEREKHAQIAIKQYSQALQAGGLDKRDQSYVYLQRGDLYLMMQDRRRAIADFTLAIDLAPKWPNPYYRRALAYQSVSEIEKALNDLDRVVALDPTFPLVHMERASLLVSLGDLTAARHALSLEIERDPNNYLAFLMRGTTYRSMEKLDEALDDYRHARELLKQRGTCPAHDEKCYSPDYVDVHLRIGEVYEHQGKYDQAIRIYKEGIQANPGSSLLHNALAWVYAAAKDAAVRDPREALSYALKANAIEGSRNADILDTLAEAYYANGKYDQAIETQKRAIQLKPEDSTLVESLRRFEEAKQKKK